MQQANNNINIIVYGSTEDDARSIAKTVFGEHQENGVYKLQHENHQLNGHIRFIGGSSYTIHQGVTDVIIVHVASASTEEYTHLQQYLRDRETVPVRIIVTSDPSVNSFAEEAKVIVTSDQSSLRSFAFTKYKEQRDLLTNLFNKHAQGEGLTAVGLDALLAELTPGVEHAERSFIYRQSPHINFHDFYLWWIFGRSDAFYYRGVIDMQHDFPRIAEHVLKHFSKIKDVVGSEFHGKMDLSPVNEQWTHGFKFGIESNFGDHYTEASQKFSHSQVSSPITASFEIGVKDPSKVPEMVKMLNTFKDMAKEMVVVFKYLLRTGLDIQFRCVDNRFFIDAVTSGLFAEMLLKAIPSNVNLNNFHFSAKTEFNISTGFSPMGVIASTLDELLKNFCNFAIQGKGDFINVGTFNSIINFILSFVVKREKDQKGVDMILAAFNVIKSCGFELKYDSGDLFHSLSEIAASQTGAQPTNDSKGNLQVLGQMFAQQQQMVGMFVEQGKSMVMFIADYLDLIKNVQFDNIAVHFSSSMMKTHAKVHIDIPGLTDFVNQTFFQ